MAGDHLDIDTSTIFDNVDEHQVEFDGDVDGDGYRFAVRYSLLEAVGGAAPDGDAISIFNQFVEVIRDASLTALSRGADLATIVVGESDLEQ